MKKKVVLGSLVRDRRLRFNHNTLKYDPPGFDKRWGIVCSVKSLEYETVGVYWNDGHKKFPVLTCDLEIIEE